MRRGLALGLVLGSLVVGSSGQEPPAAELRACVRDGARGGERLVALSALQDLGQLDPETASVALRAGGALAQMAAAIVRHEWPDVPSGLLDRVEDDADAVRALLEELALAPRPSLVRWANAQVGRENLPIGTRCLAVAAADRSPSRKEAAMLVEAATAGPAGDGYRAAIWLLPGGTADALLGRLHGLLLTEPGDLARITPFFDHLSAEGLERLLGLVVTLPSENQRRLARYFAAGDLPLYRRRVEAALDGEIPLEAIWLQGADRCLDRRPRIDRVLSLLADPDADPVLRELAFADLVAVKVFEGPVLAFADTEGAARLERIRTILDHGIADLDVDTLRGWLAEAGPVARAVVSRLANRPHLESELQQALRRAIEGIDVLGGARDYASVLLQHGSASTVTAIWPTLRSSELFPGFVDLLSRRREPWVHELLLADLEREGQEREILEALRLGLLALGDRRELSELVAGAASARPALVRRCGRLAASPGREHSLRLLADAEKVEDDDLAVEMIAWAATTEDPAVERVLLNLWERPGWTERQLAALRGLMGERTRPRLCESLRLALASGPLDDRHDALAYEIVDSMPTPLSREDVELLVEMSLTGAVHDPDGERTRARRWPDGRFGFPLVAAVAHRLRGCAPDLAGEVFGLGANRALASVAEAPLARARLLVLWRNLGPDPAVQAAVGRSTAELLLALPPVGGPGEGPARWFAMQRAERRGEFAAAAVEAHRAVAALLRWPDRFGVVRTFLGERDPSAGRDPVGALAAKPYLLEAAADAASARHALRIARELAGRDAETLRAIERLTKE